MTANTNKFTGRASDYTAYRERYDTAVVLPFLRETCGLQPDWRIADLGAGTGMLADVFLGNGNPVLAIEPNAEMREACRALHPHQHNLGLRNATAEHTGLDSASIDLIAIGRALHWFNLDRTVPELRRVLKPGGWVVVLALGRARDGREANSAFDRILRRFSPNPTAPHASYAAIERLPQIFAGGDLLHHDSKTESHLDWPALQGLSLSFSSAPLPGAPGHTDFDHAIRDFFDRYQHNGTVTFDIRHWIAAARFPLHRDPESPRSRQARTETAGNTTTLTGVNLTAIGCR